ncbi:MAG TPA: hypothetical protein VN442_11115, partial [Bryobacteraceae bacterium]|nr:hypothetical protein [Bryobacteraceae bacterium]
TEPNVGASWRTDWEFASLHAIRTATVAGTSPMADLLAWVRAGYAPRNVALRGTAHDGGDVGAVAVLASTVVPVLTPIIW